MDLQGDFDKHEKELSELKAELAATAAQAVKASVASAKGIKPVRPIWSDVMNGGMYPVFDVKKGAGKRGKYVFPDHAKNPYKGGAPRNDWTVDRDGVLVATAGHLHPGGLHNDLWLRRIFLASVLILALKTILDFGF